MGKTQGLLSHRPEHPVWARLSNYSIGPADTALSFRDRLARENDWSKSHAERVIEEYKRFTFLAVTAGHEVTPSDSIDQAWHLHLTYSRDYWERFCPEILGCALHHGPTAGGADERHRHFEQYAATLQSYEAAFGPPPADLWPAAAELLDEAPKARRVHPRDAVVIPRTAARILLLAVVAVIAAYLLW